MNVLPYVPSGLILAGVVVNDSLRTSLPRQVSSQQDAIYSAVAGVGATLLGFLIASIALLAVLPSSNLVVQRLRAQGLLSRAVREIASASTAMALFMATGLCGLVIDQPPQDAVHRGDELGRGAYWMWAVAVTALPAALLLGLSMSRVARAVRWVSDSEQPAA